MTMNKQKKDIRYLNVCIERSIHDEFEQVCEELSIGKTKACEKALRMWIDKMKPVLDAMKD